MIVYAVVDDALSLRFDYVAGVRLRDEDVLRLAGLHDAGYDDTAEARGNPWCGRDVLSENGWYRSHRAVRAVAPFALREPLLLAGELPANRSAGVDVGGN